MKQQIEAKKVKICAKIEKLDREYMERVAPLKNEIEKLDAILTVLGDHEAKSEIPPALRNMVNINNALATKGDDQ